MEIGIIGLPNVGKSTLFNALSLGDVASSNYPFTTIEPNVGLASVPDERLTRLQEIFNPKSLVQTQIKFVDIAGLVQGASQGTGLGNKFLSHIHQVDAIVHVLRCFEDENIVHTLGNVDPVRDADIINTELLLADLQSMDKQLIKINKEAKTSRDKDKMQYYETCLQVKSTLEEGIPIRNAKFDLKEIHSLHLLSAKPMLYIGNFGDTQLTQVDQYRQKMEKFIIGKSHEIFLSVCGKFESEMVQLDRESQESFREDIPNEIFSLGDIVRHAYQLLDLITFFTAGEQEVRAWTIRRGTVAKIAAGEIHSNIKDGFIKAEVYSYADVDRFGSEKHIQEQGLKRIEGKEYVIQDGDVCLFHFNFKSKN